MRISQIMVSVTIALLGFLSTSAKAQVDKSRQYNMNRTITDTLNHAGVDLNNHNGTEPISGMGMDTMNHHNMNMNRRTGMDKNNRMHMDATNHTRMNKKNKMGMNDNMMSDLKNWPESSQIAAKMIIEKYGKPNEMTAHMLVWYNNGPWKKTTIYSTETKHTFPVDHFDVMEQVIDYKVPTNKFDALAEFDGSVAVHRTDGEMSAKCDKEGANFLALNLADDVITGKKSVLEARKFYAVTIKEFALQNKMSPYMQSFQFSVSKGGTSDEDKNAVSTQDNQKIMEAMMQMNMKMKSMKSTSGAMNK